MGRHAYIAEPTHAIEYANDEVSNAFNAAWACKKKAECFICNLQNFTVETGYRNTPARHKIIVKAARTRNPIILKGKPLTEKLFLQAYGSIYNPKITQAKLTDALDILDTWSRQRGLVEDEQILVALLAAHEQFAPLHQERAIRLAENALPLLAARTKERSLLAIFVNSDSVHLRTQAYINENSSDSQKALAAILGLEEYAYTLPHGILFAKELPAEESPVEAPPVEAPPVEEVIEPETFTLENETINGEPVTEEQINAWVEEIEETLTEEELLEELTELLTDPNPIVVETIETFGISNETIDGEPITEEQIMEWVEEAEQEPTPLPVKKTRLSRREKKKASTIVEELPTNITAIEELIIEEPPVEETEQNTPEENPSPVENTPTESSHTTMLRHWNINILFDANAPEKDQIKQVIESAERSHIVINRAMAKSFIRQVNYHCTKDINE